MRVSRKPDPVSETTHEYVRAAKIGVTALAVIGVGYLVLSAWVPDYVAQFTASGVMALFGALILWRTNQRAALMYDLDHPEEGAGDPLVRVPVADGVGVDPTGVEVHKVAS